MSDQCSHLPTIRSVKPMTLGCEECLETGQIWLHLRLCRECGHVGCCDQSPAATRPRISTPPATPSSRAMTRRKAGAGVMWTKPWWTCLIRHRNAGRYRDITELRRKIGGDLRTTFPAGGNRWQISARARTRCFRCSTPSGRDGEAFCQRRAKRFRTW